MTQRGVNRCAIFLDDDDRHHYRRVLREATRRLAVAIHAFVLMDNHVHLLLSAGCAGAISQAMRRAGQTYVQSFNQRNGRVGMLWQGRFKSCLVDTDAYVLRVIRCIELNPVRAAMVAKPEDYPWSSVRTHLGTAQVPWSCRIRSTWGWDHRGTCAPRRGATGCTPRSIPMKPAASAPTWRRSGLWASRASRRWSRRHSTVPRR